MRVFFTKYVNYFIIVDISLVLIKILHNNRIGMYLEISLIWFFAVVGTLVFVFTLISFWSLLTLNLGQFRCVSMKELIKVGPLWFVMRSIKLFLSRRRLAFWRVSAIFYSIMYIFLPSFRLRNQICVLIKQINHTKKFSSFGCKNIRCFFVTNYALTFLSELL